MIAVVSAAAADWLLYALGIGSMHGIGQYQGHVWMGNMTFPGYSFAAGVVGLAVALAILIIRRRAGWQHGLFALVIFCLAFVPLCRVWFCSPRFHDSKTQQPPGWLLDGKESKNPEQSGGANGVRSATATAHLGS